MMDIARDILDKSAVDRNGREMGRVDGILLETVDGQPPRIAGLLIGPAALGDRLHPRLGQWIRAIERRVSLPDDRPVWITFDQIDDIATAIKLRVSAGDTSVGAIERRLRTWVLKIPGSG
jgi:hypothetical protein